MKAGTVSVFTQCYIPRPWHKYLNIPVKQRGFFCTHRRLTTDSPNNNLQKLWIAVVYLKLIYYCRSTIPQKKDKTSGYQWERGEGAR